MTGTTNRSEEYDKYRETLGGEDTARGRIVDEYSETLWNAKQRLKQQPGRHPAEYGVVKGDS